MWWPWLLYWLVVLLEKIVVLHCLRYNPMMQRLYYRTRDQYYKTVWQCSLIVTLRRKNLRKPAVNCNYVTKKRKMKGYLVSFDKTNTWLNLLCIGLYCAVMKPFRIPSRCEINVYLSSYPNVLWILAWLMWFTGALLLSKAIRFSRVWWSITSLRLERIIPCEFPHLVISYRSCDQF